MVSEGRQPAQHWLRYYSRTLAESFRALSIIQHNVTKGNAREFQIFDTLKELLPHRASVQQNVIIVDSLGVQAPQTDSVAFVRYEWPLLLYDDGQSILILEIVFFTS